MGLLFRKQITLRGESILHRSAYSVFFIPGSFLQGPFEGQRRIFRALSRGLLVVANDDLGIEAYSTAVLLGSQAV